MEDEEIKLLKEIRNELHELKRYARFLSVEAISNVLNNTAKTSDRQQVWRLADGTKSNEEIANQIGISLRGVQYFVQEAENVGLIIMEKRGYPKRVEDIIPKEWKPWKQTRDLKSQTSDETQKEES